jgi:7,8-dihydropterin-6-yl-methyl-4-(beta-D-ribofuranosyl)aminobenzene 5'-phosphate synthase
VAVRSVLVILTTVVMAAAAPSMRAAAQSANRLTVIVDAFGEAPALKRDWGYAALVEYGGKRILFDTGNDGAGFAANAARLGVDLTRLDAVVISHRHGDHTSGLRHVLQANPGVTVYVPDDEAFGGPTPAAFFQSGVPALPPKMRYFDGAVPDRVPHGSAWPDANFVRVDRAAEIAPGFRLVRNISRTRQFAETPELSLVVDTPAGQAVVVGCSHPGIEEILASVAARDPKVAVVAGGLHLVTTGADDVERLAAALHERWKVARVAPGHCTGERAFSILQRVFGKQYGYAGLGAIVELP